MIPSAPGVAGVHVAQIGFGYDEGLTDPDALLDRYRTLTEWSDALAGAGASRVTVVHRFHRDAELTRSGVRYIFRRDGGGPRPTHWTWPRQLLGAVVEAAPDVAHVNGLNFPLQTWLLRRTLGETTAIVVQDHASGEPRARDRSRMGALRRAARAHAMRGADAFLFTAVEQADAWRRDGFIAPDQRVCQVMEASTAVRAIERISARRASGVEGSPAVLWVGRLNDNKDPLTVLDGFEQALADLPAARLTMLYSADDLLPAVRQRLSRSDQLSCRVRLAGRVPHDLLPAFYSAADVFALGSHHEGSGYALIEACACGVVPLVTDIPAFRVITANGSVGVLWTPGDARAFSKALVAVGRQDLPNLRARMVDHFERTLSWAAVGRQAMAAYADVLAAKQRMVN